ncbi:MAG: T9SS type A sorting domain-containing protein [Crocinitomicaceae bacterium]|nr:T9SS type A sorting domain-containing protein [Crocinitomicaceae bacterium]
MKKILLTLSLALTGFASIAQNVNIPDANFKASLVGNSAVNTNMDTEIQVSEANSFSGSLNCYFLNIADFTGIEEFTSMTSFNCSQNINTTLDVSACSALTTFYASNCMSMTELNIANGNNSNMATFFADVCPNLTCVQVDDVAWSNTNWPVGTNVDATASYSLSCGPCIVSIPDANFKAYLVGNTAINTNSDTEIQCSEAASFVGTIDCENLSITDLTGIEEFVSLSTLRCGGNSITSLDLTANTNLAGTFRCDNNAISTLILPSSTALTEIYCGNNNISTIDISVVPNITLFHAVYNSLTALDVSSNMALITINFGYSPMTTIDLTGLSNLDYIACQGSGLTSLDISMCGAVTGMYAINMTAITEMNLANGNNMSFPPGNLSATGCTSLTCVTVDNVALSNSVWAPAFDPGTTFSLDCSQGGTPLATSVTAAGFGGATTVEVGATLQMLATILPANASQTAIWQVTDGTGSATIDMNSGVLTGVSVGTVTVGAAAIDGSNQFGTIEITVIEAVGLEDLNTSTVNVYPNPSSSVITVQSEYEIVTISIYNLSGVMVQTEANSTFSIETLESGTYILSANTVNGVVKKRFIKL